MARPYWKGYLKLSLVTCPVAMTPATSESEKVRFHTINKETGIRVVSQYVDTVTGKPVKDDDEAKGYARGEDDYVLLTEDDLDAIALDTVKTVDIEKFVPADSIEWVYLEKPHCLIPDDPVGQEAFAVIRDAMAADKVVGVSKLVIGRRERAVVLEPGGQGIVLWSLRFGDEVRPEQSYFEDIDNKELPAFRIIPPWTEPRGEGFRTGPLLASLWRERERFRRLTGGPVAPYPMNRPKGFHGSQRLPFLIWKRNVQAFRIVHPTDGTSSQSATSIPSHPSPAAGTAGEATRISDFFCPCLERKETFGCAVSVRLRRNP